MLRYFAYIDENTIDSFYNQLNNSFVTKKFNKTKENSADGEVKVSIMNVIRGLFSGDGTLRVSTRRLTSEEVEIANSIELKIMKLVDLAYGNEEKNIEEEIFTDKIKLICGKIRVVEIQTFLNVVSQFYNEKFENFIEFYDAYQTRSDIADRWKEVGNTEIKLNGLHILEIMDGFRIDNRKIFRLVVINCDRPIIMDISSNKITMPHSGFRSSGLFVRTTEFHILGVANVIESVKNIKPLALWLNVAEDEISGYLSDRSFFN